MNFEMVVLMSIFFPLDMVYMSLVSTTFCLFHNMQKYLYIFIHMTYLYILTNKCIWISPLKRDMILWQTSTNQHIKKKQARRPGANTNDKSSVRPGWWLPVVVPVVCFATGPPRGRRTSEILRMIRKGGKNTWNKMWCSRSNSICYNKLKPEIPNIDLSKRKVLFSVQPWSLFVFLGSRVFDRRLRAPFFLKGSQQKIVFKLVCWQNCPGRSLKVSRLFLVYVEYWPSLWN